MPTVSHRQACRLLMAVLLQAGSVAAGEWPGLRGPTHDGRAASDSAFGGAAGQLAVRWRARLGSGYSGVAVADGRAVTLFSDGSRDVLAAFDAATGREAWRVPVAEAHKGKDGSFDGPVSTPAVDRGRVFALGPRGDLVAVDLKTGALLWRVDLPEREGGRPPHYGFASSPIVAGGVLVVQVGADKGRAIAGFDPATGARRWALGEDAVQYQSPVALRLGTREIVVGVGDTRVIGIDPARGRLLFDHAHGGEPDPISVASAVPVPAGDGRLFVKTHAEKSTMFKLVEAPDGGVSVQTLWTAPVLRGTYGIPVYHEGHLYGMNGRMTFSCVDAATGQMKWRSRDPGDGWVTLAGGDLVVQAKDRTLHVGAATPEGWTERAQVRLFEDLAWTAPSVAGGAVFARSLGELARVDWAAATPAPAAAASVDLPAVSSPTFARFLEEVRRVPDNKADWVDRFLAGLPDGPLVDPPDRVVFLYRGDAADMGFASDLIGVRREDPMRRVPGTDLFFYEARVEPGTRVSYQFVRNFEQRTPDPRNPRRVPWRGEASSLVPGGWREPAHLAPAPEGRRGRLEKIEFASSLRPGTRVVLHVYLPAGYDASSERYPVAWVLDGDAAREQGLVPQSLDNLMPERVAKALVVFHGPIDWGTWKPRDEEAGAAAVELLLKELVPLVDARFRTVAEARARAVIGHSWDGITALGAVFHVSRPFGALGLQSLAILDTPEAMIRPTIRTAAEQPLRVYHDWGRYEVRSTRENADMRVSNARINAYLRERGYQPVGGEAADGTAWASWRNRTDRLFETLFPPPR
jgi:enterochelin esterase-like enzyme/outer membrane protein assembly factor BamB